MSLIAATKLKETAPSIPPLEPGDRLTRAEFHRRYAAMPELKKAELIKGVVYVPSPLRYKKHGQQTGHVNGWLAYYVAKTPGVDLGNNCTVLLEGDDEPQPDVLLLVLPEFGGQSRIDNEGFIVGAPELVVEVAASSASYDLHDKLDTYREHGVKEYVVWRVLDQAIDWFVLNKGRFENLPLGAQGRYQSQTFPGLWLDSKAMLAGDLARVFQVVEEGVATPAHQQFVARLSQHGRGG